MRSFPRALCALVLACACTTAAFATTVLPVDAPQAVDRAELIFVGTVVHLETATTGDGLLPYTFVTFAVDEALKGRAADAELTLRFEGGDLPEQQETVEVVGMPSFELGDEAVLFVAGNGEAACPLVGWWQGELSIVRHPATGERLLLDHRGAPIEGVSADGWRVGPVHYDAAEQRFVDSTADGVELLWQDGVEIVDEPSIERAGAYEGVGADSVLDALRQLVSERQERKSFTRGDVVRSADPADLPYSVTFLPVAPTE
ncbi:MAG: hypothetical protein AAGC60_25180 [Acidobacteriota bacterium]